MKKFEQVPHTADLQIRVYGATKKELFVHALIGMFQSLGPQIPGCHYEHGLVVCDQLPQRHSVVIESPDLESLLVDFLSEAIYLSDVHNEAYLDVALEAFTDTCIKATLHGIQVSGFEVVEIKAVTYNSLHIQQKDGIWQTDIVFDI